MTDPEIRIAICDHRTDRKYRNVEKSWGWLRERNRHPIRTTETAAEYPRLPKEKRDELKDQGGFVGGWLRDGIRKNGNVLGRQAAALDADSIPEGCDFLSRVRNALRGNTWFLYSTHKHTAANQRYRIVILLDREVSEEEYPPLTRMIAKGIGMDFFDDTTYQANRMMYWASCPSDGEFVFEEGEGEALAADRYLGMYDDWRDTSQWPVSSREGEILRKTIEKQQDPLTKEGLVGIFCREYFPIQKAMETFLHDVYAPTTMPNRWDYLPADSTAGVIIYQDRYVYSHHATDPAGGKLLNAFDLVRAHRFGTTEDKQSFQQMCDFVISLDDIKVRIRQEKAEEARLDFSGGVGNDLKDWRKELKYKTKTKELENSVWNLMLILRNDPELKNFAYNEMAGMVQVTGELPWDHPDYNPFWRDADSANLLIYLDTHYTIFTARNLDACFAKVVDDRHFHPVRDYLNALPEWDGIPRIDTLMTRCFEAPDTPYVHAVTRKVLTAAVARAYEPGIKFDSLMVLDGRQGIGKSTLFRVLAGDEWFSDTLSLTDMSDKSAAEKIQGSWIVEIGELAGMRKADIERVKAFLSSSNDKFRPSYGRTVEAHPRQGIMIATVNGDQGYLRDITGNRRFWIIKCGQQEGRKKWDITAEERDQIWAEALNRYRGGELLYLESEYTEEAEHYQREAMERDDRQGLVEKYLEILLPANWDQMDLFSRRNYLSAQNDPTMPAGTVKRKQVCNAEIWAECFGKPIGDLKTSDSYAIAAIMQRMKGWKKDGNRTYCAIYGRQRMYTRMD